MHLGSFHKLIILFIPDKISNYGSRLTKTKLYMSIQNLNQRTMSLVCKA